MQQGTNNLYQPIIESLINHEFIKAEKLSIDYIKDNPLNAQMWLYLAEALAFQGYGKTAEKVFQRAWLLDPQAVWVDQALEDIKQADLGKERKDIEELLEVKKISVSAAIILKNEEKHIIDCLKNLVKAVDEIVIVDTGCTDNTITIAKTFPKVKIVEFQWCDDFSAARNAALPHITSEWVLWVDADEYLYEEDIENVKTTAAIFDEVDVPVLLRIGQMNKTNDGQIVGNFDMNRMFPLKHPFKFYSRIHEQVVLDKTDMYKQASNFSNPVRIRVYHDGYTSAEINEKDKLNRNITLLQKMVEDEPKNPAWLFFLGRELCTVGRTDEGIEQLLKSEECAKDNPTFGRIMDVHARLVTAYISKQDFDKAEEVCLRSMKIRDDFPDILYSYAHVKLEKAYRLLGESEELVQKSKQAFETYRNIVSPDDSIKNWRGDLLLADIALYQGRFVQATEIYEKSQQVSPSSVQPSIQNKLDFILNQVKCFRK